MEGMKKTRLFFLDIINHILVITNNKGNQDA